jgi:hypothetical protein
MGMGQLRGRRHLFDRRVWGEYSQDWFNYWSIVMASLATYIGLFGSVLIGLFGHQVKRSDLFIICSAVLLRQRRASDSLFTVRRRVGNLLITISLVVISYDLYLWLLPGIQYIK